MLRQLKRVALGLSASLYSVLDQQGPVVTEDPAISDALRVHWEPTFARREINTRCLEQWLVEDASAPNGLLSAVQPMLRNKAAWRIRRRDVRRAVEMSSASSPGLGGSPYAAWRRLGPLAVDIR